MTATLTAPATTYGSPITARDFSDRTTDRFRDTWTRGKMRHLITALGETPVMVVIEHTTLIGVQLVGVCRNMGGQGNLIVRSILDDGTEQDTAYMLEGVGTVVALAAPNAKSDTKSSYRTERTERIVAGLNDDHFV